MLTPEPLDHAWIARHIPHQGSMCLLERVTSWDEQRIECLAISHRAADNPLRAQGRLGAACGIEYAAQAMALHGALLAQRATERARAGYLVSVRGARLWVDRLDLLADDLRICATCSTRSDNNILYAFTVDAGAQRLLEGRAAVVLNAAALAAGAGMRP
jgi:predicted hotdog family 3-hydroxylacyl-ACP dehydratase